MYNQYLKVIPNKIGKGVFTTIKIPSNIPIMEITGDLFNGENLPQHPAMLQVAPNLFIGPSGGIDDEINHSCDPNCYLHIVGNRAILYSLYVILENTEITFDYSTSSTDNLDEWQMECKCGSINCRKIISGLQYVPQKTLEYFNKKNMLPLFIKEKMFK